jgi:uncharacterized protein (TIGR03067 family)
LSLNHHEGVAVNDRIVRVVLAFAAVVSASAAAAPVPARDDTKELQKLRGEWTLVRHVEPDGTVIRHPEGSPGNSHFLLRFEGRKAVQEYDFGDPSLEITWNAVLDPSAAPKQIDLTVTDASHSAFDPCKGKARRGVYQLDGDRLIICLAELDATARPTGFDPGRDREVYELKRVKK